MGDEQLTHVDEQGQARMVDVTAKDVTERSATAEALVMMSDATLDLLFGGDLPKGDALGTARIAGVSSRREN